MCPLLKLMLACFHLLGFHGFSKILTVGRLFDQLGNPSMAIKDVICNVSAVCRQDGVIRRHQLSFARNQKQEQNH